MALEFAADVLKFSSSGLDSTLNASFLGCRRKVLSVQFQPNDEPTLPDNLQGEGERVELLKLFARSDIGLISIPPSCKAELLSGDNFSKYLSIHLQPEPVGETPPGEHQAGRRVGVGLEEVRHIGQAVPPSYSRLHRSDQREWF